MASLLLPRSSKYKCSIGLLLKIPCFGRFLIGHVCALVVFGIRIDSCLLSTLDKSHLLDLC